MPAEYDALRDVGHMARRRADLFAEAVAGSSGPVLELGCGTGALLRRLAARFPERTFLGVEPLRNYVDFARQQSEKAGLTNVRFEVAPGEELVEAAGPVPAGLVISVDVLHHVRDMGQVARQVREVTAPGGHWVAQEPNAFHPYVWLFHKLAEGERTFPARRFLDMASGAGWRVISRETMYLYPSGFATVPPWAEELERRLEKLPPVAGAVVLELAR